MLKLLRNVCFVEGLSCIALFFIAMPVKYILHEPKLVSIVGMIHGLLWIGMVAAVLMETQKNHIDIKNAFLVLIVSTFPLGMFWVDKRLASLEKTVIL